MATLENVNRPSKVLKHSPHDVLLCDLVVSCFDLQRTLKLDAEYKGTLLAGFHGDLILIVTVMAWSERIW